MKSKDKRIIHEGVWRCNPITFQVLGICSALAVTVKLETALVMSATLVFVLSLSNTLIALLRHFIPARIRIIIQLMVISSLVIIADQFLKAFMYDVSKQLSVFVGLIITNCIVMGRAEGFAMANTPWRSFLDGLSNGLGYSLILIVVATCREILGSGTWLGFPVVPQWLYDHGYANCGMMLLAPGAFFLMGIIVWLQRLMSGYKEQN